MLKNKPKEFRLGGTLFWLKLDLKNGMIDKRNCDKQGYLFIALAPVVLWGMVLLVITFIVPTSWFWVVYFVQVMNISGAVGDFYVTVKFLKFPKDILVKDSGIGMTVYSAQ